MGGRLKSFMLVLLVLAAATVAGCGGDDETTSGSEGSSAGAAKESESGSPSAGAPSGPGKSGEPSGSSGSGSTGSQGGSGDSAGSSGGSGSGDSESSPRGSADTASGAGTGLSTEEFIALGNQICLEARNEIGEEIKGVLAESNGGQSDPLGTAEKIATEVVIPHFKVQNEELRELAVPAGDEAQVEAILDRIEAEVAEAEADPKSLMGANVSPFLPTRKLAIKYGLTKCGRM